MKIDFTTMKYNKQTQLHGDARKEVSVDWRLYSVFKTNKRRMT